MRLEDVMDNSFDKAYARYLGSLAKLDAVDDIAEKNRLFRELAALLSEMENNLKNNSSPADAAESLNERPTPGYWL